MDHLSANLRRVRAARGKSQKDLAVEAGLSLSAYRKIEQGKSKEPRVRSLVSLASALDVKLGDLLREAPTLERVRFRSSKKLKLREHILTEVAHRLQDYTDLEEILGCARGAALPRPQFRGEGRGSRTAAAVREHFGLRSDEPVRDLCGLLEARGIKVLELPLESKGFFGLSVAEDGLGPAVVVNTSERISVERWIFSAAHELGHLVLHANDYDGDERDEDDLREAEANEFASAFLMPEEVFQREWDQACGLGLVDRVFKVKRMFGVSYRTVLLRVSRADADSQVFPRFFAEHRRRTGKDWPKHHEPQALGESSWRDGLPPRTEVEPKESKFAFAPERLFGLVREALEKEAISFSRGAEILGLSIREMRELTESWVG